VLCFDPGRSTIPRSPHGRDPRDPFHFSLRNDAVAKGQKKSNKEVRKPKADKPKTPVVAVSSFLTPPTAKKK
jgi:hypothetical protein